MYIKPIVYTYVIPLRHIVNLSTHLKMKIDDYGIVMEKHTHIYKPRSPMARTGPGIGLLTYLAHESTQTKTKNST